MIKKVKDSRFYPCPHTYDGEFCGGIAALVDDEYRCHRCHFVWDINGQPRPNWGTA